MTRIRFIPAQVKTFPDERPDSCKYCGSPILAKHGTAEKSVADLHVDKAATGEVLGLDVLVERDSDGFTEWLGDFARGYGVEAMASDDLNEYKPVVSAWGIDHQICVARVKEVGAEAPRQDRRLGLGQDEDMAAADGAAAVRRLGASAAGARGSGRRLDSSPSLRGAEREVAGAIMPSQAAGRPSDEQRGGARDRRASDKVRDGRGCKSEYGMLNGFGRTQRAWSGLDGLDVSELVAARRSAVFWRILALQNPPQNPQPFLGRLRGYGGA